MSGVRDRLNAAMVEARKRDSASLIGAAGKSRGVREAAPYGWGTGDVRSRLQNAMEQAREQDRKTWAVREVGGRAQAASTEGTGRASFPFKETKLASSFSTLTQRVMGGDEALKNLAWEMAQEKIGQQRIDRLDQKMADAETAGKKAGDMLYAGGRELPHTNS